MLASSTDIFLHNLMIGLMRNNDLFYDYARRLSEKRLFSIKEVAELLNKTPDTIRQRAKRGAYTVVKVGGRMKIKNDKKLRTYKIIY